MSLTECSDHAGLIDAIGTCSDETKAALNKALSYLGISFVTLGRDLTERSALVLSIHDKSTDDRVEQIEFDDEAASWYRTRRAIPIFSEADRLLQTTTLRQPSWQASMKDDDVGIDSSSPSAKDSHGDWTRSLPLTDHVEFLKSREWWKTSLGPMEKWPAPLRLMVMKMLGDPRPANLYWGPDRIAIYNEPFSILAASRHPMMMGSTAEDAMPATYPFLSKVFDKVEETGVAFSMPEFEMTVEKVAEFFEEAWYDGVFSPICDVDGTHLGFYNSGYDITTHKMTQRNAELIHQIVSGPTSPEISSWQHIAEVCSAFDRDIPFLVLYSTDSQEPAESSKLTLLYEASMAIKPSHPALPHTLDIHQGNGGFMPILRAARAKGSPVVLNMPAGKLPEFLTEGVDWRGHGEACTHIVASPLFVTGLIIGFIIVGLNPRRRYDESHEQFVEDIVRASNGLLAFGIGVKQAQQREQRLTDELTQRQKFLQRIAEVATVGLYTHSRDGLLTWANPTFFEITGVTQKSEERYNWQGVTYVHDDDQEEGRSAFLACLETKLPCTLELRLQKMWRPTESDHEEPCWVMTTLAPNLENDEAVGVIGCVTDISHLKWVEKVQTEMAEAAKLAKQQQERFIDFTSHEMRNPLGAILQCADDITMLARSHGSPSLNLDNSLRAEAFQAILENATSILFCANHQTRIVDDILTVSKLDSSMLTITPIVMDPRKVVTQTIQAYENQLSAENIESRLEVKLGYTDLQVASTLGDPSRITQILINLITNAIKFTKKASRRVLCTRIDALKQRPLLHEPDSRVQWFPSSAYLSKQETLQKVNSVDDDDVYIMFEVEDSGAGMTKEEMKGLFNRFKQASPKTHITYGGSGLGLFISRELVELQGGMIGVSSQPGIGSVFSFYIKTQKVKPSDDTDLHIEQVAGVQHMNESTTEKPRSRSFNQNSSLKQRKSSTSSPSSRSKPSESWSILYVEDNLINQKVLSKQLERFGCSVHLANHGIEALNLIRKSAYWKGNQTGGVKFDIILMDWEMPVMDGITCTKQIRDLEAAGLITKRLMIVGATANARPEQIQIALSAGMDDVVAKPFTVTTLMKQIRNLSP